MFRDSGCLGFREAYDSTESCGSSKPLLPGHSGTLMIIRAKLEHL